MLPSNAKLTDLALYTITKLSRTNTSYVGLASPCIPANHKRDIRKNGSLPSPPQLEIDILSDPSFNYSLQSRLVSGPSQFEVMLMREGPRFALVALWYFLASRSHPHSSYPKYLAGVGLFRTVSCGGWTYITSTDDHGWHDIFMIGYLLATVPWTLGCLSLSPPNPTAIKWRKRFGGTFFATLIPLIYFFIQHKVHKVPGGRIS
jgi:hypothetical protein